MFATKFATGKHLTDLPWFEQDNGGRLVVDPSIGPVIDMHTHLAMSFLRKNPVDLSALPTQTRHYLPQNKPVDLNPHSNANFDPRTLRQLKLDLSLLALTSKGMRTTHTTPALLRDMDAMNIQRSVLLPIDLKIGAQNSPAFLREAKANSRLSSFCSVHPKRNGAVNMLGQYRDQGALGLKLHPNAQFLAPDDTSVVSLCAEAARLGLPTLFHCGPAGIEPKSAQRRSQVYRYERCIADNPTATIILGHCGARQHREALTFASKYPNTIFELSALGLDAMRQVIETVPSERIVFGTDWPFYHQSLTLARVLILTEGDTELRSKILHRNAQRILEEATLVKSKD